MNGRSGPAVVLLMGALAAASSWAQDAQSVAVPVSGTYYEAAIAEMVQFSGKVRLIQVATATGSPEWRADGLTVDARLLQSGQRFNYVGTGSLVLTGALGQPESLSMPYLALAAGGAPAFSGTLVVPVTVPRDARLAVVSRAIARQGEESVYSQFAVSGRYYEKTRQGWVLYNGALHVNWVAETGVPGWMEVDVLVADAQAESGGARFIYYWVSRGHTDTAPGTLTGLSRTFWATELGAGQDFGGTLEVGAGGL
jgi:hypothetical protein